MPCSTATVHGERAGVNNHCPKNCSPSFKQQPRWKQIRLYWNKTKVMTWISMFMCPEQNIKHISLSSLQADSSKTLIWILYKCSRIFALWLILWHPENWMSLGTVGRLIQGQWEWISWLLFSTGLRWQTRVWKAVDYEPTFFFSACCFPRKSQDPWCPSNKPCITWLQFPADTHRRHIICHTAHMWISQNLSKTHPENLIQYLQIKRKKTLFCREKKIYISNKRLIFWSKNPKRDHIIHKNIK